jgi:Zn-dependent metalloprotease
MPKWDALTHLVATIAESAEKFDRSLFYYRRLAQSADPQISGSVWLQAKLQELEGVSKAVKLAQKPPKVKPRTLEITPGPNGIKRAIYNAQNKSHLPGTLAKIEGDPTSADPAVEALYENIQYFYDFFKLNYARDSIDGKGMEIVGTVHYLEKYNNAFWNGSQIVCGDGDGIIFQNFAQDLTVVALQLSHGIVQFTAGLEYRDQTGALHAHFTDVFAVLIEQWKNKQTVQEAAWLVGSEVLATDIKGQGIRSLKSPGSAYENDLMGRDPQPQHMDDYVQTEADNGGVHINSGIPNYAFYIASREIGGYAWETAGKIWYKALLLLKPHSKFSDCAQLTYSVASRDYGQDSREQLAVKKGWEAAGIKIRAADASVQ